MTTSDTDTTASEAPVARHAAHGAVLVAAGLAVGQVVSYLLSLIAARILGPDGYGAFASMLALILVGNVVALGIQAAGARRIVLMPPADRSHGGAGVVRSSAFAGVTVGIVAVVLAPFLSSFLHLSGPWLVLLVAINLLPLTVFGGLLGVGQGRESHGRLAAIYALTGIGRAAGGIAAVLIDPTALSAMIGMAVGTVICLAIAWLITSPLVRRPAAKLVGFRTEVVHATHAMFVLFVLTNLDVLLARGFLPANQAGMYAAGAIVAKVTFWLPQFVAVVAYPRLADHRRSRTLGIAALAVTAIGVVATLAVALLPNLVVAFVGGAAYLELASEVWIFAAAGAAFALAQFLLYSQIAASKRAAIVVLWLAVAALLGLVIAFHGSVLQIATIVLCVALSVSAVGIAELLVERHREKSLNAHGN